MRNAVYVYIMKRIKLLSKELYFFFIFFLNVCVIYS